MSKRHPLVPMSVLCGIFECSRQAWYKAIKSAEQEHVEMRLVIAEVALIRRQLPRCGVEKLHHLLTIRGFYDQWQLKIGRDKLADILRNNGLLIIKYRRKIYTTYSKHRFYKYPNIIKDLILTAPNQVWVSDITYIAIRNAWVYLSLITDAFSRKIVGWKVHNNLTTEGCLLALQMAIEKLPQHAKQKLIHHSDRGVQYCSNQYVELLKKNKIAISMTLNGDPYENALAERMNRTIKEEMLENRAFKNLKQAKQEIEKAIQYYNTFRPHLSLNMKTPYEVHKFFNKKVVNNCQPISE